MLCYNIYKNNFLIICQIFNYYIENYRNLYFGLNYKLQKYKIFFIDIIIFFII